MSQIRIFGLICCSDRHHTFIAPNVSFIIRLSLPMSNICEVCLFANNPSSLESSRQLPKDIKYYLSCADGIVMCEDCMDARRERMRESSGGFNPAYEVRVECLKHRRGEIIHRKLKELRHKSNSDEKNKEEEEKRVQDELGVPAEVIRELNEERQRLNADLNHLQGQIKKYEDSIKNIPLVFDIIAAFVCFVSTILITVEVSLQVASYDYQFLGPYLYVEYYIALVLSFCPYYAVVIPQAYRYLANKWQFLLALVCMLATNVFYLLLAVTISVPMGTLAIIKEKPFPYLFFIPKKAPLGWKIDHALPFLKSLVFWIILIIRRTPYKNTYELITLVWSFVEALSLVYLAIRDRYNDSFLQRLGER